METGFCFGQEVGVSRVESVTYLEPRSQSVVEFAFVKLPLARLVVRALSQSLAPLAVFAVMLLALAPGADAAWQCEGQKCGVTDWTCCCAQPNDKQDAECITAQNHFTNGVHLTEAGTCQADCHCTMVVQDHKTSVSSAPFSLIFPVLYVVPVQFKQDFDELYTVELPYRQPSRGPPLRAVYLASSPLRGPPVS